MKIKELRAMSREKLVKELEDARLELMKLEAKKSLGTLEKPKMVGNARRRVARVLTLLNEKGGKAAR